MNHIPWQNLTIERYATPPQLSDEEFRRWMTGRRIFVSSVMDDEMAPDRLAVREWLDYWDATPVMWEEITPRDERAPDAYLDGVERSQFFVLLLGTSYGVSDAQGFSPTNREEERAKERGLSRLLFIREEVSDSNRDGKLIRWIRSLYNEVSAARYADSKQLERVLERTLREIASAQETPWIKLGSIIFPGRARQRTVDHETQFILAASVRDHGVRDALRELTGWRHSGIDYLTWERGMWPISFVETEIDTQHLSTDEVMITCRLDTQRSIGAMMGFGGIGFTDASGHFAGPAEQVALWAKQALFGEVVSDRGHRMMTVEGWLAPDGPTLPEVLGREQARGWLGEGIARLYIIEGLVQKFGGQFERLDVGPATATGIRIDFRFRTEGHGERVAAVQGLVPLR